MNLTPGQIIGWIFNNLEIVIIGLVLLSTFFNLLSGGNRAQRQRAQREADMARRAQQSQGAQQSQRPPTASTSPRSNPSEAELKDLQAEILAALGMKNAPQASVNPDPQAELRRQLAEKMGRAQTPAPPARTPRPAPRPERKPIESQIEVYLDSSRPERLEGDSVPDVLGHSKRQPHFDLPRNDPTKEGSEAYKGEGGVAVIERPSAVNEVRGVGAARSSTSSVTGRMFDSRSAARGFIWAEILGKPRSRR